MYEKRLKEAEKLTNQNPTEAEKLSGDYDKGKLSIKGFIISIENPRGSIRQGKDEKDNSWSINMKHAYGYFDNSIGLDGEEVDVYIGDCLDEDFDIFIIDQVNPEDKSFDEHKVMFGFKDEESAKKAYFDSYEKGWEGFGNITCITLEYFLNWLYNSQNTQNPASSINPEYIISMSSEQQERMALIELRGAVIENQTLSDLQKQAGDINSFDTLVMEIASPGGSVSEGLRIMLWLNTLSEQGIKVVTVVTANAYSIASLIMLAANQRMISQHAEVMVHNPMIPELEYANADTLEQYAKELRQLEDILYELYCLFTKLELEAIRALMNNETYLSPKDAVQYGFADMVIDIEPKPYEMVKNKEKQTNMSQTINTLNRVIALVGQKQFCNQMYYDTDGGKLEVYQTDPTKISEGDRTNVEGGVIKLMNGDLVTIKDFVITEVKRDAVPVEPAVPAEPIPAEPATPVVEPMPAVDPEPVPAAVDPEPVPANPEPTSVDPEPMPAPAPAEPVEPAKPSIEEQMAALTALVQDMSKGFEDSLESKMTAYKAELDKEYQAKFAEMLQVQAVTADAIDAVATNISSSFKPEARAKVDSTASTLSIFQQSLKNRQK